MREDPLDLSLSVLVEVYALCLCFGFKGKHAGVQGMETLRKLRSEVITELEGANEPAVAAPTQGASVSARDVAIGRQRRKTSKKDLAPAWRAPRDASSIDRRTCPTAG